MNDRASRPTPTPEPASHDTPAGRTVRHGGRQTQDVYTQASGGWGSVKAVTSILVRTHSLVEGGKALATLNKPDGVMCVGCAWAKPASPHAFEFCESGAKATAWDLTSARADPDFFARHTVSALSSWSDHELESAGRLTHPMRWDPTTDHYVPVPWAQAIEEIAAALRECAPNDTVFYASGKASLEASYLYQLFARLFGTNNLPDSSNMCHESTSVGLTASIGVGVGTVDLADLDRAEMMFFFGQNVGTNSPRMLHPLQAARRRGVPIVTFNPLREPGLVSFVDPQSPAQMLIPGETAISTHYHQLRNGGDSAAIVGLCKALLEIDEAARARGEDGALDRAFIAEHTVGFEAFADWVGQCPWPTIERISGLRADDLRASAAVYARSGPTIAHFGMGLTQHREGVQNVRLLVNLLLMRGNIGKPGAGPSPIRGHSNVQGQRTVGITEKPELAPLDRLAELYGFEPPRDEGLATVDACEAILAGRVQALIQLGGNLARAVPDSRRMEEGWRGLALSVNVATRLNRSHVVHGRAAYLLPCLSRLEQDDGPRGPQTVSTEDSTGHFHGSLGRARPASEHLWSEPRIVAALAAATLDASRHAPIDWQGWADDYRQIRAAITRTYPETFGDYEARLKTPGGFPRPLPARDRQWKTPSGKAEFVTPTTLDVDPDMPAPPDSLSLFTLRSDSQFNTTIYDLDDRFRGIEGGRDVLFMNGDDAQARGLVEGSRVDVRTVSHDGIDRAVAALRVRLYDIPRGCVAGYYPECNPLIPLSHHARGSKVPAAKAIPVRLSAAGIPS